MERFEKIGKSNNYFPKVLYLGSVTMFWIHQTLNKYSLTCGVTSCYVLYKKCRTLSIIVNSGIFTSYSDTFSHIIAYLESCVILALFAYSTSWHILNPRYIQTSFKGYSGMFWLCNAFILRTLSYSGLCLIQNFGIFRILLITLFRYIQ